ncbi:YbjN domain-containing protein [Deinococcus detaillensis]|uniref:YbjN domain-containing protein n=1 Tax=Deinococcus detaillensis TaxID=2592048 RepID=A0A553UKV1_9DEIO|nr:YbjN domain-containing protein [Deinococcus detaillensis]TSA80833.1 YbjN domain-containing protein [Deinococcus detaillensis]
MTHTLKRAVVTSALFGLSLGLPLASAQTVIKIATPESLMPILKTAGYTVTVDRSGKSPFLKVENKTDGNDFYIDFLNCNTSSCDGAFANVFYTATDFKTKPDLKVLNTWNKEYFSQAYMDDKGNPHLISTYTFVGGFTSANFLDWVQTFYDEISQYNDMLDGKGK